ncbi:ribonuclease HII, partial [Pediococcus acidilactici]|nr:ribonuclease HII [Pediococcus acidilactici]
FVAGIDEVGRGCLAGPVVTAAVVLDDHFDLVEVNDSKQLSLKLRESLYAQILSEAVSVGIGVRSNQQIDQMGILNATKAAMNDAISHLNVTPEHLLIDAVQVPTSIPKTVMYKGDAKSISIAAASIVA